MKKLISIITLLFPVLAFGQDAAEVAVVGYEPGSLRLALVAAEPLCPSATFVITPKQDPKAAAVIRICRLVLAGEIIQIAGGYCSAGSVAFHGDPAAFRTADGLSVFRGRDPAVRVASTPSFFPEGCAYVGPRQVTSPDELDLLVAEKSNWRAGMMPAQDAFVFQKGRHLNRWEHPGHR